jgi:hypothetical protein|nr:MAG TPA: YonK protein [Caudoviricetes sp.]
MAKKSISIKFSKATLSRENDKYIITEITKDESIDYDFSEILARLESNKDLFITITYEDDIDSIVDNEHI